jgi:hypothetical protein
MKSLVFAGVLFFSGSIWAQYNASNCRVNVLENPALTAEARAHFQRAFDQYSSNMCYAHVVADILTFKSGMSISPIALSILTSQHLDQVWDKNQSMNISDSIEAANSSGSACKNSGYNSYLTEDQYDHLPTSVTCGGDNLARFNNKLAYRLYRDCLPGYTPRHTLPEDFKTTMLQQVNASLDAQQIVGLSLSLAQIEKIKPGAEREPYGSNHAVSIIGRTWNANDNQCEYVIRNSYGAEACAGILDDKLVNCKRAEGFPEGTFSMSEQMFRNAVHRLTIIKPSGTTSDEDVTPSNCVLNPNGSR